MLNNIDKILEVFESIKLESRGVLKMKVLNDAISSKDKELTHDLELLLSVFYHGLLECPKPKWKNSSQPSEGQCVAVLTQLLAGTKIDTKEFHELPLKVQVVLYYSSICSDIGLNQSQLLSAITVIPKEAVYSILGHSEALIYEINTFEVTQKCPRCGAERETPDICEECTQRIFEAIEHRTESFEVYGTSIKDFTLEFFDWKLEVKNGLYKFTKLKDSLSRYEPTLPFEEYQKTLQLIG